eukprot:jgi/Hompol1/5913/HPOL_002690-RA
MQIKPLRLGFIGGGNMAGAIIGGLLQAGHAASSITVSDPVAEARSRLTRQFGSDLRVTDSNAAAIVRAEQATLAANAEQIAASSGAPHATLEHAASTNPSVDPSVAVSDVLLLAVQPSALKHVVTELAPLIIAHRPLLISVVTGVATTDIARWILAAAPSDADAAAAEQSLAIVRCMPNTPALVVEGATGLFAGPNVTSSQKLLALSVVESVSRRNYWVDNELLLEAVTGVSGSGPAYFFLMVECLEQAGIAMGLPTDVARGLAMQTCLGAGKMLSETGEDPVELRRKVCAPNGPTEAAIKTFEAHGIRDMFLEAAKKSITRPQITHMTTAVATTELRLGFIGGGNMAGAIIGGLLQTGYRAANITVAEPWDEARSRLQTQFGVTTTTDNVAALLSGGSTASASDPAAQAVDVIVLAVKPQVMRAVATGLAPALAALSARGAATPLVISIAAGITTSDLLSWLGGSPTSSLAIVRCMPNTPALVVEGATALYASPAVSPLQRTTAFAVLQSVSRRNYWVDREDLIDVVTGVSGSGPAYFFLLVECLAEAGEKLGLPADVAKGLAAQTCMGAGKMLIETGTDPAQLRRNVTSPKGTTEAAIKTLESSGIREIFANAVKSAADRGAELGRIMGQQQ